MQRGADRDGGQRWAWTHRYAVPMFVSSLIAVVVTGAGLVAVTAFGLGGADPDDPSVPGSGGPGTVGPTGDDGGESGAAVDPCLVGTWRTVGHTETIPVVERTVELAGGGATTVFNADGTGTTDYGDGMRLAGDNVTIDFAGTVSFEYEAAGGTFRYLSQHPDATLQMTVSGVSVGSQDVRYSQEPASYECTDTTLRFVEEEQAYRGEFERAGT